MRNSLILKLMGAFLLVIVIGALVIYFFTSRATQNAFRLYTTQSSQLWAQRLAPDFADFYSLAGSWQGVDAFIETSLNSSAMPGMMGGMGQGRGLRNGTGMGYMGGMGLRVILADVQGKVIADSGGELTGSQLSAAELAVGAPVEVRGTLAGTLIITPGNLQSVTNPANTFLMTVNRSIVISVMAAGVISLLLVFLFSFQITAPIRQMEKAARAIAGGDLTQRVAVRSKDELGSLAETFNHMAGSLASAEDQRRKMIADIAHELRTPLAVIRANAEAMQDGVLPLDLDQVSAIHAETLLLNRLIDDLRLLSLAEAGELRLERQDLDPAVMLRLAAERFQSQCAQKSITFQVDSEENLPQVSADTDRINQVLSNLISNALRHTPEGGAITLHAEPVHDRKEVSFSVSDTGPGIPADDLPWVFDRFYRADRSRARTSGGTGLGLAIVKQLVEAHGGKVAAKSPAFIESLQRYGTRIEFTLPAS